MTEAIRQLSDTELEHLKGQYRRYAQDHQFSDSVRHFYGALADMMVTDAQRRLGEISELAALYRRR